MRYSLKTTTAAHFIASPRFHSTIVKFILQGNANPNGADANAKTNSSSDGNADSYSTS